MNMTLQDWIEAFHEKCDMWQCFIQTLTALTVSFAIVFGAAMGFSCGVVLTNKVFPSKATKAHIEKAAGATFPKAGIKAANAEALPRRGSDVGTSPLLGISGD